MAQIFSRISDMSRFSCWDVFFLNHLVYFATEVTATPTVTSVDGVRPMMTILDDVWPWYGPVAGGTRVTITGQRLSTVAAVYFGQHQGVVDTQRSAVFITFNVSLLISRHIYRYTLLQKCRDHTKFIKHDRSVHGGEISITLITNIQHLHVSGKLSGV